MGRNKFIRIFSFLLLFGTFPFGLPAQPVTVAYNSFPPLLFTQNPEKSPVGRLLVDCFAAEGLTVEFVALPWPRAWVSVQNGSFDLSPCWSYSEKRATEVLFSQPLYLTYQVLFHRKNLKFDWQTLADLAPYSIGTTRGFFYGQAFQDAIASGLIHPDIAQNELLGFKKLAAGRIGLLAMSVISGPEIARSALSQEEFDQITYHPRPLAAPSPHYLVFSNSPRGRNLQKIFNKFFIALAAKGQLSAYFSSHLLHPN